MASGFMHRGVRYFMVIKSDGKLEIKENIGHKGEEWVPVRIDDYIMH